MKVLDTVATGKHLRQMLRDRKISPHRLKEHLNMNHVQSLYFWFNGEHMPNLDNLVSIAEFFDCTIDDILVIKEI